MSRLPPPPRRPTWQALLADRRAERRFIELADRFLKMQAREQTQTPVARKKEKAQCS